MATYFNFKKAKTIAGQVSANYNGRMSTPFVVSQWIFILLDRQDPLSE